MAQSDTYEISDKSTMQIEGTSTLHDWTADVEEFGSNINFDASALEKEAAKSPVQTLSLTIPVESIESGKGGMNRKMYGALKSDDFPHIMFQMNDSELVSADSSLTEIKLNITGDLSIAGTNKSVTVPVTGTKQDDGSFVFNGEYEMNMKDFNVDPPSAMFGTIKSGEMVTISFEMHVTKSN